MEVKSPELVAITTVVEASHAPTITGAPKSVTAEAIQAWLSSYLAELLEVDLDEIDIDCSFNRYGLDSSAVIILTGDLETWLGRPVDPTLPYDYPTIATLAQYLAEAA